MEKANFTDIFFSTENAYYIEAAVFTDGKFPSSSVICLFTSISQFVYWTSKKYVDRNL